MSVERVRPAATNDPNYLSASGGPLQARPDMSGAALFEGLANVVGAVAQGTDQIIQNRIQKDVWSMFDQEVGVQGVDSKVEEVTGFGGPPVQDAPVPQSILGQGKSFARLQQAYEEGRISDSYYYARLEAGVRQLRAKYPGYREQIDNMVSSVTGVQPANALRRSLLSEIQQAESAAQSASSKYETFVNQNMQFAGPWAQDFAQGRLPPEGEFRAYVAQRKTEVEDISRQKTLIEFGNLTEDQRARTAGRVFTQEANAAIQGMIDAVWGKVQKAQAPDSEPTAAEREQLRQSVAQLRATAEMTLDQILNTPIGETGETYATILGQDEVRKIREQQLNRVQVLSDALTNDQFGLLNLDRNVSRNIQDENVRRYLNQFPVFQMHQALREIGGGELLNNLMLNNPQFLSDTVAAVSAITAGRIALGQTTMSQAVKELAEAGISDPATMRGVLQQGIQVISDPKSNDTIVANTIRGIFGPDGRQLMANIKQKDEFFRLFSAPVIAERVARLAQVDPSVGEMYQQTMQDWFTMAHRQDIQDLKAEASQGGPLNLIRDSNGRYRYELTEEGKRLPPNHPTRQRLVSDPLLDRVNRSLILLDTALSRTGGTMENLNRNLDMLTGMGEFAPEALTPMPEDPQENWDDLQQRLQNDITNRSNGDQPPLEQRLREETQRDVEQLNRLLESGTISQEEFDKAKERLDSRMESLGQNPADFPAVNANPAMAMVNLATLGDDGSVELTAYTPEETTEAQGYTDAEREEEFNLEELLSIVVPEGSKAVAQAKPILDLIGRAEAPQGYNQIFGRNRFAPLDQMTVAQVLQMQRQMVSRGSPSSAVGRYQFIRKTLAGLVDKLKIDPSEKFTPELQDRLAMALLEQRGLSRFLNGQISARRFQQNLSMEWAGLPSLNGRSYYAGDGLNKATVSTSQLVRALEQLRS
jgi:muramidase (phage lysozyme)